MGSLCSTSFAILIWQWAGTLIFPLDKCLSETSFQPELTVFKPVKGLEDQTLECLVSWLRQDYKGKIRYLFGVAEEDDPVLPHLRALIKQFPHLDIQVIVCRENRGLNQKVSNLIQMSFYATGMVWIISDADIYAEPYLVRNLVQPLRDSSVGAVHCLYRLTGPQGFADALERIGNNVDFWKRRLEETLEDNNNIVHKLLNEDELDDEINQDLSNSFSQEELIDAAESNLNSRVRDIFDYGDSSLDSEVYHDLAYKYDFIHRHKYGDDYILLDVKGRPNLSFGADDLGIDDDTFYYELNYLISDFAEILKEDFPEFVVLGRSGGYWGLEVSHGDLKFTRKLALKQRMTL